ncbi:NAD(P)-binding domain-containing protein [Streptosporangium sp. NBC_01755]|uniref:FAD-dependent oxidoreductase n=1 Tax=unclassified Streptosporangium TaxID=2632669 RepID=UPI002DD9B344|nr:MULTISPECIES: FAD-dependent oxidoreductase [unclassified Streptosporangium]WSA28416.1 NAD(P)-binding domain-containing protein [Streptosporangium sp. NBC_01810]WSD00094.1 NAD(P)-binding domain-containing protein [Streptosporangium sp. NBC_01755]
MSDGCCGPAAVEIEQFLAPAQTDALPIVVIGAGPVGLAAAAHLAERGLNFLILEAGQQVGASVAQWSHVRVFSPWRYNIDGAARQLLEADGWSAPDPDWLPTGAELVENYLAPLAKHPAIAPRLRLGVKVTAISRLGYDRVRSTGRDDVPFLLRLSDGEELRARAVIDASGTYTTPSVLGASGLPAYGEHEAAARIDHALPDVLGADREIYQGKHTLVVGAGHSAATTLLALAELEDTPITWAIRATNADRTYGGGEADALPARGALGTRLRAHVDSGRITLITGFYTHSITENGGQVTVISRDPSGAEQSVTVDRIVAATGYRPDHSIAAELRLDLDAILGSTRALAPLIDPNQHSCGTVPAHGVDELTHLESGYYAVGVKSYGRAPTFLMATGYEQVRSVVAALAGDWEAARDVQLDLPETGVCSSGLVEAQERRVGLATGISGGLLATSLPLVTVGGGDGDGGGCCG